MAVVLSRPPGQGRRFPFGGQGLGRFHSAFRIQQAIFTPAREGPVSLA